MKSRSDIGIDPALNAQIQLLRSRVEDDLKKPAVVMVTSARPDDGKSLTAHTLAVGFKMQGYRTALVRLSPVPVERAEGGEFLDSGGDNAPVVIELPRNEDGGVTPETLAVFVDRMRTEYDYTVVDAAAFLTSAPTMTLSRIVDGVLLAIRMGRPPCSDDQSMLKMLEHSRGRVVGVVAIEAQAAGKIRRRKREERASPSGKGAAASANGSRKPKERASAPVPVPMPIPVPVKEAAGLTNENRTPERRASPPVKEPAGSANGKPTVVWSLSRFFRPDH